MRKEKFEKPKRNNIKQLDSRGKLIRNCKEMGHKRERGRKRKDCKGYSYCRICGA